MLLQRQQLATIGKIIDYFSTNMAYKLTDNSACALLALRVTDYRVGRLHVAGLSDVPSVRGGVRGALCEERRSFRALLQAQPPPTQGPFGRNHRCQRYSTEARGTVYLA